jgi:hypothetical protein
MYLPMGPKHVLAAIALFGVLAALSHAAPLKFVFELHVLHNDLWDDGGVIAV